MNFDNKAMFENYLKNKARVVNEKMAPFMPPRPGDPEEMTHKQTFKEIYEDQIREIEDTIKDLGNIVVKLENIGLSGELIDTLKIEKDNIIKTKQKMILDLKHKILDHGNKETGKVIKSNVLY